MTKVISLRWVQQSTKPVNTTTCNNKNIITPDFQATSCSISAKARYILRKRCINKNNSKTSTPLSCKKKNIYFYSIEPLKINYIIDTITNTFSYGFINNKIISIFISDESKNIPIIEYNIETQFNYHNIKLFLKSNDIVSFFINTKGILYGISLEQIEKNDFIQNKNYLLIFSNKENKKYSTKIEDQIIEHIDIFYMKTILKNFLQKNSQNFLNDWRKIFFFVLLK